MNEDNLKLIWTNNPHEYYETKSEFRKDYEKHCEESGEEPTTYGEYDWYEELSSYDLDLKLEEFEEQMDKSSSLLFLVVGEKTNSYETSSIKGGKIFDDVASVIQFIQPEDDEFMSYYKDNEDNLIIYSSGGDDLIKYTVYHITNVGGVFLYSLTGEVNKRLIHKKLIDSKMVRPFFYEGGIDM